MRRGGAVVGACLLLVTGCSALTGRSAHDSPLTPADSPSARTSATRGAGAAFTAPATVARVLADGRRDFETIYTYDYRDLPKYVAAGRRVTLGPYRAQYEKALTGAAARQLRQLHQVQVPTADHVGIASLSGRDAVVLVNARLTASSAAGGTPTVKDVTVALQLRRSGRSWRVRALADSGAIGATVPGNAELKAAVGTVRTCVERVFGLRRAHFDGDFAAALRYTTGALRARLLQGEHQQQKTLVDGGYDLSSRITGLGVARADGPTVELVVLVDEYRLGRQGARSGPYPFAFDVVAQLTGGRWLLSRADTIS